ncbi:MAG: hypothetical protein K0S38_94 [Candidatus Paceibacter sp.]|nr:hypothetical protein [Candidatus Paceibacter sp.]
MGCVYILLARANEDELPDRAFVAPHGCGGECTVLVIEIILTPANHKDEAVIETWLGCGRAVLGERFHAEQERFAFGLVGVLQPKLQTDFRRTQFESDGLSPFADGRVITRPHAEVAQSNANEVELLDVDGRRPRCCVEDFFLAVAKVERSECAVEVVVTGSELDGPPNLEIGGRRFETEDLAERVAVGQAAGADCTGEVCQQSAFEQSTLTGASVDVVVGQQGVNLVHLLERGG